MNGEVQASRSSDSLVCTNDFTVELVNKVSTQAVMCYLQFKCDVYQIVPSKVDCIKMFMKIRISIS